MNYPHDVKALVSVLIQGLDTPKVFDSGCPDDPEQTSFDGSVRVLWDNYDANKPYDPYNMAGGNIVVLEACEHRIVLRASLNDGGPCPPDMMVTYSPVRLKAFLDWMTASGTMDDLRKLDTYAWFHCKDRKTDPAITDYMYDGRIPLDTWRQLAKLTQ